LSEYSYEIIAKNSVNHQSLYAEFSSPDSSDYPAT
ncbi:hypothetical protein SAMN05421769_0001, partial [Chryseobacterium scophthalmum]